MPDDVITRSSPLTSQSWLVRFGTRAWLSIGLILLLAVLFSVVATLSSVVVPLTIAILLGMLFAPVVDWLQRRRLPRALAATVVLLGLILVVGWSLWLTVTGIADQGPTIAQSLSNGIAELNDWLDSLGTDAGLPVAVEEGINNALRSSIGGLASWLGGAISSGFSSIWGALIASVTGAFFLYYSLVDWKAITRWAGNLLPSRPGLSGDEIVATAVGSVRSYFVGLTLSALVTVLVIGGTALFLGLDLWLTIAVVTFVTSYIPFLGAIISGVFATIVALGSSGPTDALIMLAVVLLVQNVLQTVVVTKLTSDQLSLHPIVNLSATLVGAALGGLLGSVLGAPTAATALRLRALAAERSATAQE